MNRSEFDAIAAPMAANYGIDWWKRISEVFFGELIHLSPDHFERIVAYVLRTRDRPPTLAGFAEAAAASGNAFRTVSEIRADSERARVIKSMRETPSHAVIRPYFGGHWHLSPYNPIAGTDQTLRAHRKVAALFGWKCEADHQNDDPKLNRAAAIACAPEPDSLPPLRQEEADEVGF